MNTQLQKITIASLVAIMVAVSTIGANPAFAKKAMGPHELGAVISFEKKAMGPMEKKAMGPMEKKAMGSMERKKVGSYYIAHGYGDCTVLIEIFIYDDGSQDVGSITYYGDACGQG